MNLTMHDIIIEPILSEKSSRMMEGTRYVEVPVMRRRRPKLKNEVQTGPDGKKKLVAVPANDPNAFVEVKKKVLLGTKDYYYTKQHELVNRETKKEYADPKLAEKNRKKVAVSRKKVTVKDSDVQVVKKFSFRVHKLATKTMIKKAIEALFDVKVEKVNTIARKGKPKRMGMYQGRRAHTKRAVVTLKPGFDIEFFSGM